MAIKKITPRSESTNEKESLPRSKARGLEPSSQPLDPLTIQQARLDPTGLNPDEVQHLQRTLGNLEVERLMAHQRSIQRLNGQTGNILEEPAPMQVIRQRASHKALTVTPEEKNDLSGKICWDAVAYCLSLAGLITPGQYTAWGNSEADALTKLVNTQDVSANNPNIPSDNIVGVFRIGLSNDQWVLSHVMLSLGGGLAIGSNNGCIGGTGDWSVQDLGNLLAWSPEGGTPSLGPGKEPDAPDYARKRMVYYRPVASAAGRF